jgi:hypothetical protein
LEFRGTSFGRFTGGAFYLASGALCLSLGKQHIARRTVGHDQILIIQR